MRTEIAKVFATGFLIGGISAAALTYTAIKPMSGADFEERWDSVIRGQTTSQNRALEDSFNDAVQRVKFLALGLKSLIPIQQQAEWGPIKHFAELQAVAGRVTQVKQSLWINNSKNEAVSEDELQRELKEKVSIQQIRENGYSVVRLKLDPNQGRDMMALVFMASTGQNGQPDTLVSAIVDPSQAFAGFVRFAARSEAGSLRAYLVADDGRVLAHSQPSYIGSSFADTAIFNEALKPTLEGRRLAGSGTYTSLDKLRVSASYSRVGTLPIAIAVEKVKGAPIIMTDWVKWGVQVAGVLAAVAIIGSALITRANRRVTQQAATSIVQEPVFEVELLKRANQMAKKQEDALKAKAETLQTLIEEMPMTAQAFTPTREAVVAGPAHDILQAPEDLVAFPNPKDDEALLARFEREMATTPDVRKASARLASLASRLCKSPTLFFMYQDRLQACVLKCYAGFDGVQAPKAMAFAVPSTLLQSIYTQEQRGQAVSLAEYTPLAQLLLERTGVSHYEAWVVTGYGEQGRHEKRPAALGVLVILKAGYESAIRRDALARAMRITGTVYESTATPPTATT